MTDQIAAFAHEELGLDLNPGQSRALAEWTEGTYQQAAWRWGRRAGKSTLADVIALYDVSARGHLRRYMRPGELRIAAIVAPTLSQSSRHIETAAALLAHSPRLTRMLTSRTSDELRFSNGSAIRAYPCSARALRGDAWSSVVLDEFGHFIDSENGNAAGDRVLDAAVPSLAQFGAEGWLIAISTPRWRQGAFYRLVERAERGTNPHLHALHLTTQQANDRIDPAWLAARRLEDPDLYSREFEALFIDGASAYLTSADIAACQRQAGILAPQPGVRYAAALDPAYAIDGFSMAVAHTDTERALIVIDGVWVWQRRGHNATLDAVAEVADAYSIHRLRTDQASPVPIREGLEQRGLQADYRPWTNESKSSAFSRLKIALNTRGIELPADEALASELMGLEARPTPSGMTRIAAAGAGHDDRAVAVAAVVDVLSKKAPRDLGALAAGLAGVSLLTRESPWGIGPRTPTDPSGGRW